MKSIPRLFRPARFDFSHGCVASLSAHEGRALREVRIETSSKETSY